MRKIYSSIIICLTLLLGNNIFVKAQFGSDLGSEAISTLAWDHIYSHANDRASSGSIGLTTDNRMYVWGSNSAYTIHSKSYISGAGNSGGPQYQMVPYFVPSPAGETITKVRIMGNSVAGYISTYFALSQSGKLYAWGINAGLEKTQWPAVATIPSSTDTSTSVRKPILLTVLPETSFIDFEVSKRAGYWVAISTTGKAYHIGLSGASTSTTVFTALPNPAGVDAATFKYTKVWLCDYEDANSPYIYLKGNNGKIYYTGKYDFAYGCGVPTIVPYADINISSPNRFWTAITSNEATGRILLFAPIEVPFPTGEDIIDMKVGIVGNANKRGNVYAISASGKGYLAGCWRSFPISLTGARPVDFYTIAPLKNVPPISDVYKTTIASTDSLYILTRFTEIAMPSGATKMIDANFIEAGVNVGTLATFDNGRAYWSGRNTAVDPYTVFSGNYLSLDEKLNGNIAGYCSNVGNVASNSFYNWTYEAINYKGATKVEEVATTAAGYTGIFIISKIGRGYYVGYHSPHTGLGKMTPSQNGQAGSRLYYPVPIANERLLDCQTSPGIGGPLAPVTPPSNTAVGVIDCSKTQLSPAPVFGTATQLDLIVSINVTTAGTFTPITVSGSGMTVANDVSSVTTATTGIQTFHIPMKYDGTTLGTLNFTIGSAGSCTADLTQQPTQKITNVWTLSNCSAIVPGTLSK